MKCKWLTCLAFVLALLAGAAQAATGLAGQLQGTWSLTRALDHYDDGHDEFTWGEQPSGSLVLTEGGRFSFVIVGGDLPEKSPAPFIAGRRVIAMTGSYSVDEAARQLTFHIERSSFPGWDRLSRTSTVVQINGDMLELHSARVTGANGSWVPRNHWQRMN